MAILSNMAVLFLTFFFLEIKIKLIELVIQLELDFARYIKHSD